MECHEISVDLAGHLGLAGTNNAAVIQIDLRDGVWTLRAAQRGLSDAIPASSASIFDHGIEMMQLDPFRQFGPFFFTQTDHIELLHNHPSQLWPAAYWEATYHACALR